MIEKGTFDSPSCPCAQPSSRAMYSKGFSKSIFPFLQASASEMRLQVPRVSTEGVLWLESECAGIVSDATPVVLVADMDLVEEIQSLGESETCQEMQESAVCSLLVDIGMTLQYAQHLSDPSAGQTQETTGKGLPSYARLERPGDKLKYVYCPTTCKTPDIMGHASSALQTSSSKLLVLCMRVLVADTSGEVTQQ